MISNTVLISSARLLFQVLASLYTLALSRAAGQGLSEALGLEFTPRKQGVGKCWGARASWGGKELELRGELSGLKTCLPGLCKYSGYHRKKGCGERGL